MALRTLLFAVGASVLAIGVAAAAALGTTGATAQQGSDPDLICDEDGVSVAFVHAGGIVSKAVVSGIDFAAGTGCGGASLSFDTDAAEGCPCFVFLIANNMYTLTFPIPVSLAAIGSSTVTWVGPDQEN